MIFVEPDGATPLDPDEIAGLKFKHVTTRGQLDELEQANITQGLRWLDRRKRRKDDILDDAFLRKLHTQLFGDVWSWAGEYRRTEKNIGIDPVQISVQLCNLLGDARYWSEHATFAPLEAGARFHHRLVQIHPFPNGNGRHARIATDAMLQDYFKHDPIRWTDGFDLQTDNARRADYIAALRAADKGDFQPLLVFVGAQI
ncbi:mobile mystery protein B [Agrobacterium vitis]|uniref:Mobile mystery protein B n=1 Tax=Agrobacterium vitis TaxID=373 RepID=A0A6L6VH18_AGRVI|nr:mobile mystery protein B [Agrobacterium vitis]MUZ74904.1 mobile mystery protein B [Agrobacterium vitis]MVA19926.1 mobile mystery protein B [Agrobacterium vitis]